MKFEVVVLLLAVTAVYAQKPVPCTTPPQWSARFMEYDSRRGIAVNGQITYDAIYKRERTIEEVQLGKNRTYYDVLRLYNQKIEYVLDIVAKQCTTRPITRDWVSYVCLFYRILLQSFVIFYLITFKERFRHSSKWNLLWRVILRLICYSKC